MGRLRGGWVGGSCCRNFPKVVSYVFTIGRSFINQAFLKQVFIMFSMLFKGVGLESCRKLRSDGVHGCHLIDGFNRSVTGKVVSFVGDRMPVFVIRE
ncbi:hypothetical protein K0038_02077 [Pseudomonas syringae]|nr:hypothetical protein [Pseudomonas syringae]